MGSSVCLDLTILLEKGFYSITDSFRLARPSPTPGVSTVLPIVREWSQNSQEMFSRETERPGPALQYGRGPGGTTGSQNPRLV